jgi:hypothetical protein
LDVPFPFSDHVLLAKRDARSEFSLSKYNKNRNPSAWEFAPSSLPRKKRGKRPLSFHQPTDATQTARSRSLDQSKSYYDTTQTQNPWGKRPNECCSPLNDLFETPQPLIEIPSSKISTNTYLEEEIQQTTEPNLPYPAEDIKFHDEEKQSDESSLLPVVDCRLTIQSSTPKRDAKYLELSPDETSLLPPAALGGVKSVCNFFETIIVHPQPKVQTHNDDQLDYLNSRRTVSQLKNIFEPHS